MPVLEPLALFAATSVLAALPLGPALGELRRSRDAAALPIRRDDDDIRNFAETFRAFSHVYLERAGQELEQSGALIFHKGEYRPFSNTDNETVRGVVLSKTDLSLGQGMVFSDDLYCAGTLIGGALNVYRSLLGEEDVCLGERSQVLRWLHAGGSISLGPGCRLHGRASAEFVIYLRPGCTFRRMHAPVVAAVRNELQRRPSRHTPVNTGADFGLSRFPSRLDGYFYLPAGATHEGSVIARGKALLGAASRLSGNLKAHGTVHVNEQAEIEGSLVSTSTIHLAEDCFVRGPIISEKKVFVSPGAQIGSPESLTTISAPKISIAPGAVIHGTVWARDAGEVSG
ncbi:MAG TPA: polymer-forming cytoskeletal protein [Terriglobales bacterium]|nr:polymer-forming cytoskeletal protein [Terriglobales bacterium]